MASCLSHRFIFGVQGSRSNAIAFSDQNTIVYVAGHNIVIYSILDGKQRFIHGSESSESITAMALCPSARFVALAENGDKPTVSNEDNVDAINLYVRCGFYPSALRAKQYQVPGSLVSCTRYVRMVSSTRYLV